eukprot:11603718-Ditylum_brightwellii.AAC.1
MTKLFTAYLVASNSNCIRRIRANKDAYNDSACINIDTLISHAKMKYEILKQQGTWNAMSHEQEQIVALAPTAKKLKDDNLKFPNKSSLEAYTGNKKSTKIKAKTMERPRK